MRRHASARLLRRLAFLTLCLPAVAHADVKSATEQGFYVESVALIAKSPARVYMALTRSVALWWDPAHTYSGSSDNLYIEPRQQGCFCERLERGGGVRHMTVIYAEPEKMLRMSGGLGPLQGLAVSGVLTFSLTERGASTRVVASYKVSGWDPDGLALWAAPVDNVIAAQLARLERYVELGDPAAP